jgi:hypothetical protein
MLADAALPSNAAWRTMTTPVPLSCAPSRDPAIEVRTETHPLVQPSADGSDRGVSSIGPIRRLADRPHYRSRTRQK